VPQILRRFRQSALAAAGSGLLSEEWRATTWAESSAEALRRVFADRKTEWDDMLLQRKAAGIRPPRRSASLKLSECAAPAPLEMPEVPAGWEIVPLGDLVLRAQYGTSVKASARAKGGVPVLRMGNIQNGEIDTSSLKYVEATLENLESFVLQPGDILFNRTNSPELVGKAAVYDRETRAIFASYLVRLTCDPKLALSPYVCAWINSPWGRWWARTVRTDCVSQSNINASKLLAMPVPLPPLAEQVEIVRRMTALFQYADAIEGRVASATARADKLERMILAKALRGELVPTEAELASFDGRSGESAALLLERVRGQRSHAGERLRTRLRRNKAEPREEPAPRPTVLTARPGGSSPPGTGGVTLEDYSSDRILMAFRQACWGARVLSRDDLLRGVAYRLGFARLGQRIRTGLEAHLRTAVARRIVAPSPDGSDGYFGATPKFGRYDYDFLMGTLRVVLRKHTEYEPEAVIRAVAAWLGFGNVTDAMRERMNEVFEVAVRRGILAETGGRFWRRI
jgi:type I restriction enzyme S subunit